MRLQSKTAIVTGAAKGMGAAITTTLAREGADVLLTARDTAALDEVASEVRKLGRKAHVVACDVIEEDQVAAMVGKALELFDGRIDILVNVAGVTGPIETPVQEIKVEDFDYVIIANERGTFLPIKHVVPTMIAQKSGNIVNISGTSGLRGYPMRTSYSASKWAVRGITRTVALELGRYNINVNAVCPGGVATDMLKSVADFLAPRLGQEPGKLFDTMYPAQLGRHIQPIEVGRVVAFLLSDAAVVIRGQSINVDGGDTPD